MRTLFKQVVISLILGILAGFLILKVSGLEKVDIGRTINSLIDSGQKEEKVVPNDTNLPIRQFKI